jgi:tetratricopeptide (TPR) repeat protein
MRMRFRVLALLLLAGGAAAQDATPAERFLRQERAAFAHFNKKEWPQAIAAFEQQLAIFHGNPRPYYNIACCYALQGDAERAATWLRLSITNGWRDAAHLGKDPDFDSVRGSEPFRECLLQLERARRQDPAALPRRIPPELVAGAASVHAILRDSLRAESQLQPQQDLLGEHQYRKQLFQIYDIRMARLTRYVAENGDAPDADEAAEVRVRTAMAYLVQATGGNEADDELREVAARHVLRGAEEFLRGYPSSPRLANVLYWRAHALARLQQPEPAERALRQLLADYGDASPQARVELCALLADHGSREDLAREYEALMAKWGERVLRGTVRIQLAKARLLAEGIPPDMAKTLRAPAAEGAAPLLCVFVSIHSVESERRLEGLREPALGGRFRPVVICADAPQRTPDEEIRRWLETHAAGMPAIARGAELFVDLWLFEVPTLLLVRDGGEVLAFDPTDAELAKLAR